jgi:quinol monooxygenase YgiN
MPPDLGNHSGKMPVFMCKEEDLKTMVLVVITMKVLPKKRQELLQAIRAVMADTEKEEGCLSQHLCEDGENAFTLFCEWKTEEDFHRHLQSDLFAVLLGTAPLLSEAPDVRINAVSHTEGMEAIHRARGAKGRLQSGG